MKRHDWVDKLFFTIDELEKEPFEWGKIDCCMFAARIVDAMCDTSYAADLAKEYDDEKSALAYIKSFGSIKEAVSSWLGEPSDKTIYTQRGDVVLFENDGRETLGICVGSTIVSTGEFGIVHVPVYNALYRWAV
jgi:hypothetical protein